jgi:hypothetical protein
MVLYIMYNTRSEARAGGKLRSVAPGESRGTPKLTGFGRSWPEVLFWETPPQC